MSLPQVSSLDTARSTSQRVATPDIAPNSAAAGQNPQGGMQLRNEFLQMMVAQIQNQDPTNPLDGAQYVTQLAQFSMVEGVESLKVLQQKSINMMDTQQVLQSTDLIDKEVMVPSKTLTQSAEKGIRGQIELAGAADQVELKVYDEHGTLVATKNWGDSKAGGLDYELPPLPAGEYSFAVKASLDGVVTTSKNFVASKVERVTLPGTGEIMLQVAGVGDVPLFSAIQFGKSA
ncbi:flagellar hook capping protein [Aeromonas salmonicida subsp. achromogenes]|uniref:flagellar hook assembly protein FlgD n=1 Tax=Aeromonas salmonicida TaxID=645 RepID=UPI0002DE1B9D|nr:flagellar hook capping FlgD N-terminal domain-containing protein [Aeromonas salmonicida]MUG27988.1 flagellar hook capping protein [Aeromonas salmonicida]TMX11278.1 flagellar hook capping protein [Aeromonas salmonicida subsp. achromogenes]TMX14410.1 flagellar hook capping protein [Aeromonas salmonicida subsp. achromogenes]TMX14776.1 flagellar hook capping protein [Aeromonas salmonicida subsp. achromogenes]TMX20017.1 flagellar hook capping protein [Aeromonas salmonicida subsp. achromogenes]